MSSIRSLLPAATRRPREPLRSGRCASTANKCTIPAARRTAAHLGRWQARYSPSVLRRTALLEAVSWRFTRRDYLRTSLAAAVTAASGLACAPNFRIGELRANPRRRAPTLLVFITGVYDKTEDVQSHGVIDVVRKRVGPIDSVVVHHETPSFMAGEFTDEFHQRVANNPRYRRYEHRVLVGFSSGGTAALTYVSKQPTQFHS